jgi:hypothetical protein
MQRNEIWVSKANNGYQGVLLGDKSESEEYKSRPAWQCTFLYNITGGYEMQDFSYSKRSVFTPIINSLKDSFLPKPKRGKEYAILTFSNVNLDQYGDGSGFIFEDTLLEQYEKADDAIIVDVPDVKPTTTFSSGDTVIWATLEGLNKK